MCWKASCVWPLKCHSIDVVAIASIELSSPSPILSRAAAKANVSGSSQPAFSESMLEASSQIDSSVDGSPNGTRRQSGSFEDANAQSTVLGGRTVTLPNDFQQMVTASQPELSAHALLTIPNVVPMQLLHANGTEAPDTSANSSTRSTVAPLMSRIKSNHAQSGAFLSADPQPRQFQWGSGRGQAGSISIDPRSQSVKTPVISSPTSEHVSRERSLDSSVLATAVTAPNATMVEVSDTSIAAANGSNPNSMSPLLSGIEPNNAQSEVFLFAGPQPSQFQRGSAQDRVESILMDTGSQGIKTSKTSLPTTDDSLSSEAATAPSNTAQPVPSNALPTSPDAVQNTATKRLLTVPLSQFLDARPLPNSTPVQNAGTNVSDKVLAESVLSGIHNADSTTVRNSIPNVVPTPLLDVPFSPVPVAVPLAAIKSTAKADVVPTLGDVSTVHGIPFTAMSDQSTLRAGPSGTGTTGDQSVVLAQPVGGLNVAAAGTEANMNPALGAKTSIATVTTGKDGSKDEASGATGLKQNLQATSNQVGSQPGSSEAPTSGNQAQGGTSSQAQGAEPFQLNFANHVNSTISQVQTTTMASPISMQIASMPANVASHTAKTQDNVAPGSTAVPQALPAINTARLIQTIGQSEMRVGLHSTEFGNISIRTSVTPQQMTAQISLDHSDLSQALTSHVSSVQSKLENDYGLHTVIEVNHQGAASSGESGNSASGEQKEFVRSTPIMNTAVAAEPEMDPEHGAPVSASNGLRLDIRA